MIKKAIQRMTLCIALGAMATALASAQGTDSNMGQSTSDKMGSGQMGNSQMSNGKMGSLSMADKQFIEKAAQGGMAEVEFGQMAKEKGSSDAVKRFGQRMVDDHTKANDQLKQLAANKGVDVPATLDAKDEATKMKLSKLSGEAFDRAYMKDMVTDHTKDVSEFKHESQSANDPAVKNFASETLPTLEDHLKSAKNVDSGLKMATSASAK
jgi:putative membrane protein